MNPINLYKSSEKTQTMTTVKQFRKMITEVKNSFLIRK